MKLLVLTDIHGRRHLFKDLSGSLKESIDYIIVAGDLTYFEKKEKALEILESLYNVLGKPIYFIPGNCDDPELLSIDKIDDKPIYNVHSKVYTLNHYLIYGIGGSNITPFSTPIEWSEDQIKEFIDIIQKHGVFDDLIMVTHIPIYGVMDEINDENVGSQVLRGFLEKYQPILWITGHLHEYSGYTRVGKTIVLNPGPFMRGYYALVNISLDKNVKISIYNVLNK